MSATAPLLDSPSAEPLAGNYFVAAYPPFSVWQPEQVSSFRTALEKPGTRAPLGLYVHIPFCPKKCDYCYYLSYTGQNTDSVDAYIEALVAEFRLYARWPAVAERPVSFVYFGGGTPSTLTPAQVRTLGRGLRSALDWKPVEEITFECAPRSVRPELLTALREIGVTRISMGVQSFSDDLLKWNGRVHLAKDVARAYDLLKNAGFQWINLDLMVGMIGETAELWQKSMHEVLRLGPDSVTIYQTEMPHNTQLYRDWKSGGLPAAPVSWETKRLRLLQGFAALERAGYTVLSAYNAVKDPGRQRLKYQDYLWGGEDMLGLGVAAFGYFGGVHFQNEVTREKYLTAVAQGEIPVKRAYALSDFDQMVREFVLQLKFGEVNVGSFGDKFGVDVTQVFAEPLTQLSQEGFLTFSPVGVRLTRAGLLRVDRFLPRFYAASFQNLRYT